MAVLRLAALSGAFPDRAPDVAPPAGFSGTRQPPLPGTWRATGTYTQSRGYYGRATGERITRRWTTTRRCAQGRCSWFITRQLRDFPPQTARLTSHADGWHATFPKLRLQCHGPRVTWIQRTTAIFRFERNGQAQAHEVKLSYAKPCGYGTSRMDWHATRVTSARDALENAGPINVNAGPVNDVAERDMAASVARAVRRAMPHVEDLVSDEAGRHIDLVRLAGTFTCRSRENTASGRGAAFECLVPLAGTKSAGADASVGVLVAEIEGRCWRGLVYRFAAGNEPLRVLAVDTQVRELELHPLRDCA